jgi:hypothetical protein
MHLGRKSTTAVEEITRPFAQEVVENHPSPNFLYARMNMTQDLTVIAFKHRRRPGHSIVKVGLDNAFQFRDVIRYISEIPDELLAERARIVEFATEAFSGNIVALNNLLNYIHDADDTCFTEEMAES